MPAKFALHYLFNGLEAAPVVQAALCEKIADWDARPPGEDRFTVREALAHLADWEPIWLERITRTVKEDFPSLPDMDEGKLAIERNYSASDPAESLRRYREGRAALVAFLRGLSEEDWGRQCHREGQGDVWLLELAMIVLGHDAYHHRHTVESAVTVISA